MWCSVILNHSFISSKTILQYVEFVARRENCGLHLYTILMTHFQIYSHCSHCKWGYIPLISYINETPVQILLSSGYSLCTISCVLPMYVWESSRFPWFSSICIICLFHASLFFIERSVPLCISWVSLARLGTHTSSFSCLLILVEVLALFYVLLSFSFPVFDAFPSQRPLYRYTLK